MRDLCEGLPEKCRDDEGTVMKEFLSGNDAVAHAVKLCRTPLIAAYPITPQTSIYERLSSWEASGQLKGIMMRTESEHSAMASCIAASLTGVRTFTATSSQGLALMHEMLHFAAGCRVPIVMVNVNRIISAPWGFWADHLDSLSQRDTGWMQFYCENGQEALDTVIQAYKIAEQVYLPAMIATDAFFVSHFVEPVEVPEQEQVDAFLPPLDLPHRFDVDKPGFLMPVVTSEFYRHYKNAAHTAMNSVQDIAAQVDREFHQQFGRGYGVVESLMTEDAEVVVVTEGSMTSTARVSIGSLRQEGIKAGLLKLRLFRPFPVAAVQKALSGKKKIVVIDRNCSVGSGGIFCQELRAAMVHSSDHPAIYSFIAGVGGTDITPEVIRRIVLKTLKSSKPADSPEWIMNDEE
jgi:pyruvate/2-oxoacid:ferredoxin oxidoreductase alpha subunit